MFHLGPMKRDLKTPIKSYIFKINISKAIKWYIEHQKLVPPEKYSTLCFYSKKAEKVIIFKNKNALINISICVLQNGMLGGNEPQSIKILFTLKGESIKITLL